MEWIQTNEGFVRSDHIVAILQNNTVREGQINLLLSNGDTISYRDYGFNKAQALEEIENLIHQLSKNNRPIDYAVYTKLP